MGQNPFVSRAPQVRREEQQLLAVGVQLRLIELDVRQALQLERLDLVSLSRELGGSVHLERSSVVRASSRSLDRHVV